MPQWTVTVTFSCELRVRETVIRTVYAQTRDMALNVVLEDIDITWGGMEPQIEQAEVQPA